MAIGPVANLASRLCDKAKDGQILITQRVHAELEDRVEVDSLGELEFKWLQKAVPVYQVLSVLRPSPI